MDSAECWAGEKLSRLVAAAFATEPEDVRERLGRFLRCEVCKAPAAFRRASRNGHAPCFFSRHLPGRGCGSKNQDAVAVAIAQEVSRIELDVTVLKLDLDLHESDPPAASASTQAHPAEAPAGRVQRQHTGPQQGTPRVSQVGGLRMLQYLISSPDFRTSRLKIDIGDGRAPQSAAQTFRPFEDATVPEGARRGAWHGYWGQIADASYSMEWLNTGGRDNVSVTVDGKIRADEYRRWGITDRESLSGAYCLVFGTPKLSTHGKVFIHAVQPGRIVLWPSDGNG